MPAFNPNIMGHNFIPSPSRAYFGCSCGVTIPYSEVNAVNLGLKPSLAVRDMSGAFISYCSATAPHPYAPAPPTLDWSGLSYSDQPKPRPTCLGCSRELCDELDRSWVKGTEGLCAKCQRNPPKVFSAGISFADLVNSTYAAAKRKP